MGRERKMTTASDTPVTRLVRSYIIYPCRGHNIYIYISFKKEKERDPPVPMEPTGTNEKNETCVENCENVTKGGGYRHPPKMDFFFFLSNLYFSR